MLGRTIDSLFAGCFLLSLVVVAGQVKTREEEHAHESGMRPLDQTLMEGALAAYDRGETSKAEPVLRDLAPRYPAKFEIVETLGLIYAEQGDLPRAVSFLEGACKTNSASAPAWANLGAAYLRLNKNNEAVRALEKAAMLDPKNSQTQSSLGQALLLTNQPQKAAKAFSVANEGKPDDPDILYN